MPFVSEWNLDGDIQGSLNASLIPNVGRTSEWDMMREIQFVPSPYTIPSVTVSLNQTMFIVGQTGIVTFVFTEVPIGFSLSSISSPSGALSSLVVTGNPLIYTAVFTPTSDINSPINVITVGTAWHNSLGISPLKNANSVNYEVHTVRPSVSITCAEGNSTDAAQVHLTITFSESVIGFVVGKITSPNFVFSDFAGSGAVYTVTATPTSYVCTVDIANNVCSSLFGNGNTIAFRLTIVLSSVWYLSGAIPAADCVAAYKPIGANSYAESKVNHVSPGVYDTDDSVAPPTWGTVEGWVGDGSQLLDTGIIPGNNANWSMIIRFSSYFDATFGKNLCGVTEGGSYFGFIKSNTNVLYAYGYDGQLQFISSVLTEGVLAITKAKPYRNGIPESWVASAGNISIPTKSIHIFEVNNSGGSPAPSQIQAVAIYNTQLTDAQVVSLTSVMSAFFGSGGTPPVPNQTDWIVSP